MDNNPVASAEVGQLDDLQVIAERAQVARAIAALADRYRELNQEMTRRGACGGCCGDAVYHAAGQGGAAAGGRDAAR